MKKLYAYNLLAGLGLFIVFFLMPSKTQAAVISGELVNSTAGIDSPFTLTIKIDASSSINAIQGDMVLPDSLVPVSVSDADSIINFWADTPHISETKHIIFSGIIPSGFTGSGVLIRLQVKAANKGTYMLALPQDQFHVYLNGPDGQEDLVTTNDFSFTVDAGQSSTESISSDTIPPEHFLITITRDPLIADNKWVAVFATQDKQSGIKEYQVSESYESKVTDYSKLKWNTTESPYILNDQRLQSYVYVRAIDNNGNERVEIFPPQYPATWYDYIIYNIPVLLIILVAGYFVVKILWKFYLHLFKKKELK